MTSLNMMKKYPETKCQLILQNSCNIQTLYSMNHSKMILLLFLIAIQFVFSYFSKQCRIIEDKSDWMPSSRITKRDFHYIYSALRILRTLRCPDTLLCSLKITPNYFPRQLSKLNYI